MLAVCVFVNADFSGIGKWKYAVEKMANHAYVLYLLHYTPVMNCAMPVLLEHYKLSSLAVKLMIYSISLVAGAWVLRKVVEKPMLAFRNRHFPPLA
jgi:peptidoglycan/LPS O-acetylase OafA/YrhL